MTTRNLRTQDQLPEKKQLGVGWRWFWASIYLFLVVILHSLVALLVLYNLREIPQETNLNKITLDSILNGDYANIKSFNGTWISDREFLYLVEGDTFIFDAELLSRKEVTVSLRPYPDISDFHTPLSPDKKYYLSSHYEGNVWNIYAYNQKEKTEFLVYNGSSQLQLLAWGNRGSQMVYQHHHDLYYKSSLEAPPSRITWTGHPEVLKYHYQSEFMSPGGMALFYFTYNMSLVPPLTMLHYTRPDISLRQPRIPLASTEDVIKSLTLFQPEEYHVVAIHPPVEYRNRELSPVWSFWLDDTAFLVGWANRKRDLMISSSCRKDLKWRCLLVHKSTSLKAWLSTEAIPGTFEVYFTLLSWQSFLHVAQVSIRTGGIKFLTSGNFDVIRLLKYDTSSKRVYFLSSLEGKPGESHLMWVSHAGGDMTCVTCGSPCLSATAEFSRGPQPLFYILQCWGPAVPVTELYRIRDNGLMVVWEDNARLKEVSSQLRWPTVQEVIIPLQGDIEGAARLLIPPQLKPGHKYPMVVQIGWKPGVNQLDEDFAVLWGHFLASSMEVVFAVVDGRGSQGRGDDVRFQLYQRLGVIEAEDQLTAIRYLTEHLTYLDPSKVAVMGSGYGGLVTSLVLAAQSSVVSCGIAVCPVSDLAQHKSSDVYKYMGSPEENPAGYEAANVLNQVHNFAGKQFLLIHYMMENVSVPPFQHSAWLMQALVEQGIHFRSQMYPDGSHPLVRNHSNQLILSFLQQDCGFSLPTSPAPEDGF